MVMPIINSSNTKPSNCFHSKSNSIFFVFKYSAPNIKYFKSNYIWNIFNLILKANYYYTLHSTMHYIVAKVKKNYKPTNYFLKNFK